MGGAAPSEPPLLLRCRLPPAALPPEPELKEPLRGLNPKGWMSATSAASKSPMAASAPAAGCAGGAGRALRRSCLVCSRRFTRKAPAAKR